MTWEDGWGLGCGCGSHCPTEWGVFKDTVAKGKESVSGAGSLVVSLSSVSLSAERVVCSLPTPTQGPYGKVASRLVVIWV